MAPPQSRRGVKLEARVSSLIGQRKTGDEFTTKRLLVEYKRPIRPRQTASTPIPPRKFDRVQLASRQKKIERHRKLEREKRERRDRVATISAAKHVQRMRRGYLARRDYAMIKDLSLEQTQFEREPLSRRGSGIGIGRRQGGSRRSLTPAEADREFLLSLAAKEGEETKTRGPAPAPNEYVYQYKPWDDDNDNADAAAVDTTQDLWKRRKDGAEEMKKARPPPFLSRSPMNMSTRTLADEDFLTLLGADAEEIAKFHELEELPDEPLLAPIGMEPPSLAELSRSRRDLFASARSLQVELSGSNSNSSSTTNTRSLKTVHAPAAAAPEYESGLSAEHLRRMARGKAELGPHGLGPREEAARLQAAFSAAAPATGALPYASASAGPGGPRPSLLPSPPPPPPPPPGTTFVMRNNNKENNDRDSKTHRRSPASASVAPGAWVPRRGVRGVCRAYWQNTVTGKTAWHLPVEALQASFFEFALDDLFGRLASTAHQSKSARRDNNSWANKNPLPPPPPVPSTAMHMPPPPPMSQTSAMTDNGRSASELAPVSSAWESSLDELSRLAYDDNGDDGERHYRRRRLSTGTTVTEATRNSELRGEYNDMFASIRQEGGSRGDPRHLLDMGSPLVQADYAIAPHFSPRDDDDTFSWEDGI